MNARNSPTDSLDLLLGPMCNTFGVIVLVACITALLAQTSSNEQATSHNPMSELLERRIKIARAEAVKLNELLGDSPLPVNRATAEKLAELERLREILEALRQQSNELNKSLSQAAARAAIDPGASVRELKNQYRAHQDEIQAAQNLIQALEGESERLNHRKAELDKDRTTASNARTVKMRFPREHTSYLHPFSVIVRHGLVYPLNLADLSKNPAIERTSEPDDGERCEPIRGKGWSLSKNDTELRHLLAVLRGADCYISLYVYPDSFDVCRLLREIIAHEGLQFGIRPVLEQVPLIFSSKGTSPPPL